MSRLPNLQRDQVPEQFREAFDELTASTGGVITGGPGSIMINSPEMSRRRTHLTSYLRYESTFGGNLRELAILTAARAMDCQYVWNAHAPLARQAGVSDALIEAMRDRKPLPDLGADEAALLNYGSEFFQNHKVSQETFQAAPSRLFRRSFLGIGLWFGQRDPDVVMRRIGIRHCSLYRHQLAAS